MRTRPEPTSGRGGPTLTVSALGLALAVAGGVLAARPAAPAPEGPTTVPAAVLPAARPTTPPGADDPTAAYAFGPVVRFEAAGPPGPSRTAHPARGRPVRLVVPALAVDAPVIGIDAPGGVLLPPGDPQILGWWRSGAVPGARTGSALVTGHTVSTGGGAFDDLETLQPGDDVRVRTASGVVRYEVSGVTIYRKGRLARRAARVFSQSVPGRLVLITCEDWNGSAYLSNAVVVAEPTG